MDGRGCNGTCTECFLKVEAEARQIVDDLADCGLRGVGLGGGSILQRSAMRHLTLKPFLT